MQWTVCKECQGNNGDHWPWCSQYRRFMRRWRRGWLAWRASRRLPARDFTHPRAIKGGHGLIEDPFWALIAVGVAQLVIIAIFVVIGTIMYGPMGQG